MQTISQSFTLLWSALFLDNKAYAAIRDDKSPVVKGLIILLLLGVVVAAAGIIGTTLEWASSPSVDDIQQIVLETYEQADWWQFITGDPEANAQFQRWWDLGWQFGSMFAPSPATSLVGLILTPLGMIINWLIIGLLLHVAARILGGKGNLSQTYGTTALAFAPQLLLLVTVLPFAAVVGIQTWTLLCGYMAIRVAHHLSWGRALWTIILTALFLAVIALILGVGAGILFGTLIASAVQGGF